LLERLEGALKESRCPIELALIQGFRSTIDGVPGAERTSHFSIPDRGARRVVDSEFSKEIRKQSLNLLSAADRVRSCLRRGGGFGD
jgi:hypothetical protein